MGKKLDELKAEYRSTLKSSDTEEHIDLAFYRPIGYGWAVICRRLHITPNAITIASIFIGVAAGICFYPTSIATNILGIFLLIWANSLDSADGQLARLTKQYSRIGRILDGMAGDMWFISIYVCICLRSVHSIEFFAVHPYWIWILASCAGLCHARQAAIADYFRQFHLMFTKKEFPTEFENSATILSQIKSTKGNPLKRLVLRVYYLYTRNQERSNPQMQHLLDDLHRLYPDGNVPAELTEEIRSATAGLCKWENFLTFNWRSITLFITVLIGLPFIYFIVELTVFNAVMIYLIRKHERVCRHFVEKLGHMKVK